jgi:hypothetical protein
MWVIMVNVDTVDMASSRGTSPNADRTPVVNGLTMAALVTIKPDEREVNDSKDNTAKK